MRGLPRWRGAGVQPVGAMPPPPPAAAWKLHGAETRKDRDHVTSLTCEREMLSEHVHSTGDSALSFVPCVLHMGTI